MAIVKKLETPEGARRRIQLLSPADYEPIGEIECMSDEDVKAAFEKAKKAQPAWAALSVRERGAYMMRALDYLVNNIDEFIDVALKETPKTRNEFLMMDVFAACDALHYYAKKSEKILRPERKTLHGLVGVGKKCTVYYKPVGVVGVISPWNGPFILSLNPTIQALMAGNTVMLKPSSATAFSGGETVKTLFEAAGLPEGVFNLIQGDSRTGQALLEVGVNKISFTGSEGVGIHVAKCCAERLIPCSLELGGKNAMIVCHDADLDRAAAGGVAGNFFNAGQYCGGIERIYVVESVADAFIEKVVAIASKLRLNTEGEFDMGALYTEAQFETVKEHVEDARAKGAKVLCGGQPAPNLKGLYYEATVLTDVTTEMRSLAEETFGPVMNIIRVKDEEEALRLVNDSNYGLTGSVWTKDVERGVEIAKRIDTGSVDVNDFPQTYGTIEAPFGGRKASGIGQVNGPTGLRSYCHAQPVQVDRFGGKQTAGVFPRDNSQDEGFQKFIKFLWGTAAGRAISLMRIPW